MEIEPKIKDFQGKPLPGLYMGTGGSSEGINNCIIFKTRNEEIKVQLKLEYKKDKKILLRIFDYYIKKGINVRLPESKINIF